MFITGYKNDYRPSVLTEVQIGISHFYLPGRVAILRRQYKVLCTHLLVGTSHQVTPGVMCMRVACLQLHKQVGWLRPRALYTES